MLEFIKDNLIRVFLTVATLIVSILSFASAFVSNWGPSGILAICATIIGFTCAVIVMIWILEE